MWLKHKVKSELRSKLLNTLFYSEEISLTCRSCLVVNCFLPKKGTRETSLSRLIRLSSSFCSSILNENQQDSPYLSKFRIVESFFAYILFIFCCQKLFTSLFTVFRKSIVHLPQTPRRVCCHTYTNNQTRSPKKVHKVTVEGEIIL